MKRPTLLTQVLAVNALLITATVFAASVAASLHSDPLIERKRFLVLVAPIEKCRIGTQAERIF